MRAHDARIDVRKIRICHAKRPRQVAAQIVENHVSAGYQPTKDSLARMRFEVQAEAFLASVETMEEQAVTIRTEMGSDVASHVTARRVLYLDDPSAEVGEQHGPERAGAILFHGKHCKAV